MFDFKEVIKRHLNPSNREIKPEEKKAKLQLASAVHTNGMFQELFGDAHETVLLEIIEAVRKGDLESARVYTLLADQISEIIAGFASLHQSLADESREDTLTPNQTVSGQHPDDLAL